MTPQLLIASAELLGMDVPATFRRALGHGVGFRSLDEEARFEAILNDATEPAKPSRWRKQRGGGSLVASGSACGGSEAAAPSNPRLTMEEARFLPRRAAK